MCLEEGRIETPSSVFRDEVFICVVSLSKSFVSCLVREKSTVSYQNHVR
jgi:hypothetical protein